MDVGRVFHKMLFYNCPKLNFNTEPDELNPGPKRESARHNIIFLISRHSDE